MPLSQALNQFAQNFGRYQLSGLVPTWGSPFTRAMNACEAKTDPDEWDRSVNDLQIYQLSDGGRTLTIDGESYGDIAVCIFDELKMPDSIRTTIEHTRLIDGTLSDSWDDIDVTWNYHPDRGLWMVFER